MMTKIYGLYLKVGSTKMAGYLNERKIIVLVTLISVVNDDFQVV